MDATKDGAVSAVKKVRLQLQSEPLYKVFQKKEEQSHISVVGRKSHSLGGNGLGSTPTMSVIHHAVVSISLKNRLKSTSFIFKHIRFPHTHTALGL